MPEWLKAGQKTDSAKQEAPQNTTEPNAEPKAPAEKSNEAKPIIGDDVPDWLKAGQSNDEKKSAEPKSLRPAPAPEAQAKKKEAPGWLEAGLKVADQEGQSVDSPPPAELKDTPAAPKVQSRQNDATEEESKDWSEMTKEEKERERKRQKRRRYRENKKKKKTEEQPNEEQKTEPDADSNTTQKTEPESSEVQFMISADSISDAQSEGGDSADASDAKE